MPTINILLLLIIQPHILSQYKMLMIINTIGYRLVSPRIVVVVVSNIDSMCIGGGGGGDPVPVWVTNCSIVRRCGRRDEQQSLTPAPNQNFRYFFVISYLEARWNETGGVVVNKWKPTARKSRW